MKWFLVRGVTGETDINVREGDEGDEDLTLGFNLMRALAAESGMAEIGPGVWRHSAEGVTWIPKRDLE